MEENFVTLQQILEFREWKASVQKNMLRSDQEGVVVSLGMNIPGPIKHSPSIVSAFREGKYRLEKTLLSLGCSIQKKESAEEKAGCMAIFLVKNVDSYTIKRGAVALEETHSLGRLFDIDVMDHEVGALTREMTGSKRRKCLLCEEDAKVCGRSRAHTVEELQKKTFEIIEVWKEKVSDEIGLKVYRALLDEVYTTPKPGLVDLYSCGAHKDMNVETFEKSARALKPYFMIMADKGINWKGSEKELFMEIRPIGVEAEKAMYTTTGGVNTHKGLIFTLGIYCTAAAYCKSRDGYISGRQLQKVQQAMTVDILTKELEELKKTEPASNGEKNLQYYGTEGVRGEAIQGYPMVWQYALKVLHQGIVEKRDYNLARLQTLFTLMQYTQDSNILSRKDPETLSQVQKQAESFLMRGGAYEPENYQELFNMDTEYKYENISPGGSADLLATTIFIESILDEE